MSSLHLSSGGVNNWMQRRRMRVSVTSRWNNHCCHRCFFLELFIVLLWKNDREREEETLQVTSRWQVKISQSINTDDTHNLCVYSTQIKLTHRVLVCVRMSCTELIWQKRSAQQASGKESSPIHAHMAHIRTRACIFTTLNYVSGYYCLVWQPNIFFYHQTDYDNCKSFVMSSALTESIEIFSNFLPPRSEWRAKRKYSVCVCLTDLVLSLPEDRGHSRAQQHFPPEDWMYECNFNQETWDPRRYTSADI